LRGTVPLDIEIFTPFLGVVMKTLVKPAELQSGKIYNLTYVGDNQDFAAINGKRTILVMATRPKLEYVQLHDQFASPMLDDVRGNTVTVSNPTLTFKDYEITEPADESEWFKHSVKVLSLDAALEQKLIAPDDIKSHLVQNGRSAFVGCAEQGGKFLGLYTAFNVEGRAEHPLLQKVCVWWNSWDEMEKDFEKHDVNIRGKKKIFLTLKRVWEVLDGSKPGTKTTIPPGRHEFVRVKNPFGHKAPWLVLKDTLIGATEGFWRDWQNGTLADNPHHPSFGKPIDWGDCEIVVEEVEW
jgi:hypothetical protein